MWAWILTSAVPKQDWVVEENGVKDQSPSRIHALEVVATLVFRARGACRLLYVWPRGAVSFRELSSDPGLFLYLY